MFFNLLCNLSPGTEGQEFPLVAVHVGETEHLFAFHYLDIKFFCDINNNRTRDPGGIRTS